MRVLESLVVLLESDFEVRILLLFLGPISAVFFFSSVYMKYRNTDKSYQFERTTRVELSDQQRYDTYATHIRKTSRSRIDGEGRSSNPRMRL